MKPTPPLAIADGNAMARLLNHERTTNGTDDIVRGALSSSTKLKAYEIKSVLGKGAFGVTYRAHDPTLRRDVAIKEYLPTALSLREDGNAVLPISDEHAADFTWGRDRFLGEARTLAQLDRMPSIVRVFEYFEANGTAYMVMALIEGETLSKRLLREHHLASRAVEHLLFPLLDGLEEVHTAGFLHRDIKPQNIMVDSRGRPTLIDFGASRAAVAERSTGHTAIFTPAYAAVEQFTSSTPGPWTDIYSLAATLYHAITGRPPPNSIERMARDTYEPLVTLQPEGFAQGLLAAIDRGIAIQAEDRPRSISEWRRMLRSETLQPLGEQATEVMRSKPSRAGLRWNESRITGLPWILAVGMTALAVGGGYVVDTIKLTADASADREAQARANLLLNRSIDEMEAQQARLEAERDGAVEITFPPSLLTRRDDPDVVKVTTNEQHQFEQRRAAHAAQKTQLAEQINQLRQLIASSEEQVTAKTREIDVVQKELAPISALLAKGLVSRERAMALEREAARLPGERGALMASIAQAKGRVSEIQLKVLQMDEALRSDAVRGLGELQNKRAQFIERRTGR